MEQLLQWWVCGKCRHEHSRVLPPEVAAFAERSKWNTTCPKCSNPDYASISFPRPRLTTELVEEWATNVDLSFSEQDEDLSLASKTYLPLLQQFVLRRDIPEVKRATLLSAMCVIIFENTFDPLEPNVSIDAVLADQVVQFLKDNLELFTEIDNGYLYEYIMEDVYPQLGITNNEST